MPVITDPDEPPAKCCKFCEESKHNVDGEPVSWRLTLDQDLIDTLKESFPHWFHQATTASLNSHSTLEIGTTDNTTTIVEEFNNNNSNYNYNSHLLKGPINYNQNNFAEGSIISTTNYLTSETTDKNNNNNCVEGKIKKQQYNKTGGSNNETRTQYLKQFNGDESIINLGSSLLSKDSYPVSWIKYGCSLYAKNVLTKSQKQTSKCYCRTKSVPLSNNKGKINYSSSLDSSLCSTSSETASSNILSPYSYLTTSPLSLSESPQLNLKTFHNNRCFLVTDNPVVTTAPTVINTTSTIISQTSVASQPALSVHNLTYNNCDAKKGSLVTGFSSLDSVTFEILADSSSYKQLLTTPSSLTSTSTSYTFVQNLAIEAPIDYTCPKNIALHNDDMSQSDQQCLNAPLFTDIRDCKDDINSIELYDSMQSPPKTFVDSSPLQPAMIKNKESLKVKLMVRRPHSQLVEQGIIPQLKTSPAIHEQCKQLERAKTSDLLKAKIQQRPNREDLERRHILEEDECHIDPSLAEKQRMLKKARLADQLNSQIQHRPGPLELIKKNILHTEKPIEKIVKEGLVTFKATSEGLLTRPQHPNSYVTFEEESLSSEGDSVRLTPPRGSSIDNAASITTNHNSFTTSDIVQRPSDGSFALASSTPTTSENILVRCPTDDATASQQLDFQRNSTLNQTIPADLSGFKVTQKTSNLYEELCQSVAGSSNNYLSLISSLPQTTHESTVSTLSSLAPAVSSAISYSVTLATPTITSSGLQISKSDAPGKDKNRKKSKPKASKARTIKFHEYKGPPSASNKNSMDTSLTTEETSYQLMLEQQNCLLKFLETLNKNQSILPLGNAAIHNAVASNVTTISSNDKLGTSVTNTVITAQANSNSNFSPSTSSSNTSTSMQGISSETFLHSTSHFDTVSATLNNNSNCVPQTFCTTSVVSSTTSTIYSTSVNSVSASSYTEPIIDFNKLEKMKVSDLKMHLKRRNLPVSGPKQQLIERLRIHLPLEKLDKIVPNAIRSISNKETEREKSVESMDTQTASTVSDVPNINPEIEQIEILQQMCSPKSVVLSNTIPQTPQPETATIIRSNEELLKEQQKKIDELQKQLERSQQELQEIRQRQQQQRISRKLYQENIPNGLTTQQVTVSHPQMKEESSVSAVKVSHKTAPTIKGSTTSNKKSNHTVDDSNVKQINSTTIMSQKMVVKQQLEAKIQKQAAAAAAASRAHAHSQTQTVQMQISNAQQKQAHQIRLMTQKSQTVVIPPTASVLQSNLQSNVVVSKMNEKMNALKDTCNNISVKAIQPGIEIVPTQCQLSPITKAQSNLGLVWNEGNQTIFLVGLNDQSHTIGNINMARTNSHTIENNRRLFNSRQCVNTLSNVVLSLPPEVASNQHCQHMVTKLLPGHVALNQAKELLTAQQLQKIQQKQPNIKMEEFSFNQLTNKQQNLDVTMVPTSRYEDGSSKYDTKIPVSNNIKNNNKQQQQQQHILTLVNPLIQIKEESSLRSNIYIENDQQKQQMEYKSNIIQGAVVKAERVTNVLDTLIEQTQVEENVTQVNKSYSSNDNNALVHDGEQHNQQINVHRMAVDTNNELTKKYCEEMQVSISPSPNACSAYTKSLDTPSAVVYTNYMPTMMKAPHSDLNINVTNINKSFDIFLDANQQITSNNLDKSNCNEDTLINERKVDSQNNCTSPSTINCSEQQQCNSNVADQAPTLNRLTDNNAKFDHFDEFELLELMSQQLDMDIGDPSELTSYDHHTLNGKLTANTDSITEAYLSSKKLNGDGTCIGTTNGLRRSLNPSMQPSLTELMQNHNQSPGNVNNRFSHHEICNNNNVSNNVSNEYGIDNLNQFDTSILTKQYHSPSTSSSPSLSLRQKEQQPNDVIDNNHSSLSIQMDTENSIMPMDVCDDFDNPLNGFNFSPSTSNIDTLRQSTPMSDQFDLNSISSNVDPSITKSVDGTLSTKCDGILQSNNNFHNNMYNVQPNHEEMPAYNRTLTEDGPTTHRDTFCSVSSDIFDLLSMDDYRMSWNEGDFVV